MAGVDVGGGGKGGRRSLDSEINMIPMIDLLMVTISFLLITAVWTHMSRLEATAKVPGNDVTPPCEGTCAPEQTLHVDVRDDERFVLTWREGQTIVRSVEVPRQELVIAERGVRVVRFPELAARVSEEWNANGKHRAPSDAKRDRVVVHTPNDTPYATLIGVIDAVSSPQRDYAAPGSKPAKTSAFDVTFAVN
jgi:biopolymer transport protein ExbD